MVGFEQQCSHGAEFSKTKQGESDQTLKLQFDIFIFSASHFHSLLFFLCQQVAVVVTEPDSEQVEDISTPPTEPQVEPIEAVGTEP